MPPLCICCPEVIRMNTCPVRPDAIACIRGGRYVPQLAGEIRFYQHCGRVLISVTVSGLPKDNPSGFFALHIHEGSCCTGEDFSDTGSHYNPAGTPHPRHAGDLPPLLSCHGKAYMSVWTDRFRVEDVIGRTVVIHGGPDDFSSQPAGNAGSKIACGQIVRAC